jgi:argininosuccinate synthase
LRFGRLGGLITPMKIILAYSGGLDTSVLLSWIKEKYNAG